LPRAREDVQHADVQLLTMLKGGDPKTVGAEELLAAIGTALTASATSAQTAPPGPMALRLDGVQAWL